MINLIPAEAKKQLVREYWIRTVTVWFYVWAFAIGLGTIMLIPSYVLVNLQVKAYTESAMVADQTNADYETVAAELAAASETATTLQAGLALPLMSSYLAALRSFESADIAVTQLSFEREGVGVGPVTLMGMATDRQALAAFRSRMLEDDLIETVYLPISNLAKDRQIPFELTVAISSSTKP